MVLTLGGDTIEELATSVKIEVEVDIMSGLMAGEWLSIARGYRENGKSTSE